jgi:tetratricopeptide (TPR) repeat protein
MAKLDDDINALFKAPLTEFIAARKALAARLKKDGFASEAEWVKALAKPSISVWTVNQLYWQHREEFDELIATGRRFRKAQASGKMVNMREALDARREALSHLSDLAIEVLRDAGNNPSLDTLRRISTTLEALSAYASQTDGPTPGRLTRHIDPPGFDSFASFIPSAGTKARTAETPRVSPAKPVASSKTSKKTKAKGEASRREERQARINAAKVSLKEARKSLTAAQTAVKSLEGARKKAEAMAKEAEKQKREAEERFKKAITAFTDANLRTQSVGVELTRATKALEEAKRVVEKATAELESAFQDSL